MPLKYFLFAAIAVFGALVGWVAFATWALYHGQPVVADVMNDLAAAGVICYFGRLEGTDDE